MCRLSLMVAAVGLVLAAGSASAAHRSGFWGSRYCLQGQSYGYPGLCQFSTFQSCQASASGTLSSCGINPQYAAYARQRSRHGQPAY
jgi:hypothetical protein